MMVGGRLTADTFRDEMEAFCKTCDSVQEVEKVEEGSESVFCVACGEEFVPSSGSGADADPYSNYKIGLVKSVEAIPKQKDLKKVMVDVVGDGEETSLVQIVTNAKYIDAGWKVVVALENAVVPAGASLEDGTDAIQIKPTSVGGVKSSGMLCDSPMLNWTGGAKGAVQQLPDTFVIGDKPPAARPRA